MKGFSRFGAVGLSCEAAIAEPERYPFARLCKGEVGNYISGETCQQSCANAGHNYADPPCCTSQPPSAPPAAPTICNEHAASTVSVHAWDEGVAFYTGSLEGTAYGGSGDGKLLYRLAEKRCANFGTCSTEHPTSGTSQVNTELFAL